MTSQNLKKFLALACALAAVAVANAVTVAVKDRAILLDGKPAKLWGIRVASASQTQELTDKLLANLDDYRAHGVNALAVFYMGSLGKYEDPFSADGRTLDAGHRARMDAIIRACNQRGIVVVVGVFYQRSDQPRLKDWAAATNAVRTAIDAVRGHPNVIFNIANEQNSEHYEDTPWRQVRDPEALLELCRVARAADPKRVIGAGGYDHAKNEVIGRSRDVDLLLYDTKDEDNAQVFRRFVAAGVNKPMVNIELFGGWTKRFQPPGVFPEDGKRRHLEAIDQALAHEHLHIFFHSSPWFQGTADPKPREPLHFHLGGQGTADDRGVRWFFERVKAVATSGAGGVGSTAAVLTSLDEPLRGRTSGKVGADPGQLTPEGWRITSENSQLTWDLGRAYAEGTVEFEVKGELLQEDKRVLLALWNVPEGSEQDAAGKDIPHSAFFQVRLMDEGMLLRLTARSQTKTIEKHTGVLTWPDRETWVHIKATFNTRKGGVCRLWRDGIEIRHGALRGNVAPGFRYLFLGRDNYGPNYVAVPGFVFRNLKVYDLK